MSSVFTLSGTPKKDAVRIAKKMARWMKKSDWSEFDRQAAKFANGPNEQDNLPF